MATAQAQLQDAQVIAAWNEYLETISTCCDVNYTEVEEWAWDRLQSRLRRCDLDARP